MVDEVTKLRAQVVERTVLADVRDEALRDFVGQRIAQWNQAIRATRGPRRGESADSYRARLLAANAKP